MCGRRGPHPNAHIYTITYADLHGDTDPDANVSGCAYACADPYTADLGYPKHEQGKHRCQRPLPSASAAHHAIAKATP